MEKSFSIFDEVSTERTFAKFTTVGDSYEGTYVGRTDNVPNMYGQNQTLIDLKQKDGTVITVSIRDSKTILLNQMDQVMLGQIIGFKFTHTKENKLGNDSKIIKLVADAKYVDRAWIEENEKRQAEIAKQFGAKTPEQITEAQLTKMAPGEAFPDAPAPIAENAPAAPVDAGKLRIITDLASAKFNTTDLDMLKAKIMETTGLAVLPSNFDNIIKLLS